jgi:hypothetical protein
MIKHVVTSAIMALALATAVPLFAQSVDAYDLGSSYSGGDSVAGLLDPSRLKVSHAMSFMAGGSRFADVKSQSV